MPHSSKTAPPAPGLSYRDAGVDIDAGNALVERIRPSVARTRRAEVLGGVGGFGALFQLPLDRYRQPVLVSGTDGVGTKLKLAIDSGEHGGVGIDLVAMCVNDLVVLGAEPLFFLDYYATGRLDVEVAATVVDGIARGCELAGAALVGGETAEMPGMYTGGDYDLAGFCVGIVERDAIVDGQRVQVGDQLIGLASSGPHSNGYSLIRKVLETSGHNLDTRVDGQRLGALLLEPTRIYVPALQALLQAVDVRAIAHITGGGVVENIPRVLPTGVSAHIRREAWPRPAVFNWLQEQGRIGDPEMWRTFNCGVGMVVCVPPADVEAALATLAAAGEQAWRIGELRAGDPGEARVVLD